MECCLRGNETRGFFPLEPFLPFGAHPISSIKWRLTHERFRRRSQVRLDVLSPPNRFQPSQQDDGQSYGSSEGLEMQRQLRRIGHLRSVTVIDWVVRDPAALLDRLKALGNCGGVR